ncbi:MAG: hypothetical protein EXR05_10835 [Acetobacteraceae bacterium]|nr:hypothetical protein [Acetobacteraceae bacterium]MSP30493.1 hypothetical protein [Acetobacteraceae bacterium]
MVGKGRFLDNIFIEWLWRSLKCEEVFIKAYPSVGEARGGIGLWLSFYNDKRLHQALGYHTPHEIFEAIPTIGYVDTASLLATTPWAPQQQKKGLIDQEKMAGRTSRGNVWGNL